MTQQIELSPEQIFESVLKFYPAQDHDLLRKAFEYAKKAHEGQKRSSGEPYIVHPVAVAKILADMELDTTSVVTALLHDTVEDTAITIKDVEKGFGKSVADLVDGVTKLSKITFTTTEEKQAENFRKMIVAMAKDIRVIIIKLADRLNNMRTLDHLPTIKQQIIAQETLDIYAPIANRLGISWIKTEFEDLSLRYLHPDIYFKLAQKISKSKKERAKYIEEVCEILQDKLNDYDIEAQITGRAKHYYSVYKKMENRSVDFDQVHDLIAFRILVENITECYKTLGVIHAMYKPVPGRIKDYIAMPKSNSYQSLHTTVIGPYGERMEIQIRTNEMHEIAERGIAAHWKYKEGKFENKSKENVEWVGRLMEWQKDLSDPNEFLETVRIDLFSEDVFVFTPKGEVKQLPFSATPLDFAYAVHTDVGNKCIGAKVNGKIVPLKHRLKSGDTVEIITSATQTPSKDWLKIVRSSRAKAKIRNFIKQQERDRSKELGHELLEKALKPYERTIPKVEKSGQLEKAAQKFNCRTTESLFVALGYGRVLAENVIKELIPKEEFDKHQEQPPQTDAEKESFLNKVFKAARKRSEARNAITVANLDDVLIRFGRCCNPVPGDSIIGFITRGRGVTIHSATCAKALDMDPERRVPVRWNLKNVGQHSHHVRIRILCLDNPGLLASMSQTISSSGVNIASVNIRTTKDKMAICVFEIEVHDSEQLRKVISALESTNGVVSVIRSRS